MAASNVAVVSDRPDWARNLSDREFVFVRSYICHFNATRAAMDAGVKKGTARDTGYTLKHKPHVRAAINSAMQEAMPAIKLTIAERLAAIVTTDIGEVMDWGNKRIVINEGEKYLSGAREGQPKPKRYARALDVQVKDLKNISETARAAIKGVKKRVGLYGTSLELVMHDPVIAAERLQGLLELTKEDGKSAGGTVIFVIEAPDGTVIRDVSAPPVIDHEAVTQSIRANKEPDADELPPGAVRKGGLEIEIPE